jgi:hypothetical protein
MQLPRPVVFIGLGVAFCIGLFLTWYEQKRIRQQSARHATAEKVVVNERLA